MSLDARIVATRWARQLPREFARDLAAALRGGHSALSELQVRTALPASAAAARTGQSLADQGDAAFAAGVLTGHLDASAQAPQVTPVWTGPESVGGQGRLTLAVMADLLDEAEHEILLVSYATMPSRDVRNALSAAADRGVQITLLLERPTDNPNFRGQSDPFPGLQARRLVWPTSARPSGASMHAKLMVIDRRLALVGSANLTGYALERNLECGLLVRGGAVPDALANHLLSVPELVED